MNIREIFDQKKEDFFVLFWLVGALSRVSNRGEEEEEQKEQDDDDERQQ